MSCLKITRFVVWLATAVLVASCGDGADVEAPDALGPYAVGHTVFTAVDAARDDRQLLVDVWYPVDEADAATEPRTEYPLASVFTLPSEVAVDDLPVSSEEARAFLVFSLQVFMHGYKKESI